jgi:hypothetical protein
MELNIFLEATLILNFGYLERFAQLSMTAINEGTLTHPR